ncbi:zf-HC2 domain-containing protein [Paenibacillus sp. GCM10023252]|uniref:anti-sigma factor family protein n=1 Tax=Paenibacillus sp. GCM10023252 TaxID=3252649 RepID=UPI00361E8A78
MNCQEVMEYMHRQLDGDLDEREAELLRSHTRHCPDCAAMYERLQKLSADLDNLPKVTPSYSLVDAILPRLQELEESGNSTLTAVPSRQEAPARKATGRFSWKALSGVAAAGLVAAAFLVLSPQIPNLTSMKGDSNDAAMNTASTQESANVDTYAFKKQATATDKSEPLSSDEGSRSFMLDSIEEIEQNSTDMGNEGGGPADAPDQGSAEGDKLRVDQPGITSMDEQSSGGSGEAVPSPPIHLAVSPDGKLRAEIIDNSLRIYTASNEELFNSQRKNGKFANLIWSDDSKQLTYEISALQGGSTQKFIIDVAQGKETRATP